MRRLQKVLLTSAFHKNMLYFMCIDDIRLLSILSINRAELLLGDDARFVYAVSPWMYHYCWPLDTGSPFTFFINMPVGFFYLISINGRIPYV